MKLHLHNSSKNRLSNFVACVLPKTKRVPWPKLMVSRLLTVICFICLVLVLLKFATIKLKISSQYQHQIQKMMEIMIRKVKPSDWKEVVHRLIPDMPEKKKKRVFHLIILSMLSLLLKQSCWRNSSLILKNSPSFLVLTDFVKKPWRMRQVLKPNELMDKHQESI